MTCLSNLKLSREFHDIWAFWHGFYPSTIKYIPKPHYNIGFKSHDTNLIPKPHFLNKFDSKISWICSWYFFQRSHHPLWQSNMATENPELNRGFHRKITYKWSIFHGHVWLLEDTFHGESPMGSPIWSLLGQGPAAPGDPAETKPPAPGCPAERRGTRGQPYGSKTWRKGNFWENDGRS